MGAVNAHYHSHQESYSAGEPGVPAKPSRGIEIEMSEMDYYPFKIEKDPNCGCCTGWAQHLRRSGFTVRVEETLDLDAIRNRLGVPAELAACHTAEVGGYVIEGHVPAEAIHRLFQDRPSGRGIAVPGMPAGSPGMEAAHPQTYTVLLFGPTATDPSCDSGARSLPRGSRRSYRFTSASKKCGC